MVEPVNIHHQSTKDCLDIKKRLSTFYKPVFPQLTIIRTHLHVSHSSGTILEYFLHCSRWCRKFGLVINSLLSSSEELNNELQTQIFFRTEFVVFSNLHLFHQRKQVALIEVNMSQVLRYMCGLLMKTNGSLQPIIKDACNM